MRLRWHRDVLRRGSQGRALATVHGSDAADWWWAAGCENLGVPRAESRTMLVASLADAKRDAETYVRACLDKPE